MRLLLTLTLLSFSITLLAQGLEERAYKEVIKSGLSTAPGLVVIIAKNLKTGQSKEICTDAISFYWSIKEETVNSNHEELIKILLSHASDRTFEFKTEEALKRINFKYYTLKHEFDISRAIEQNHLLDSLTKITKLRETLMEQFYIYSDKRKDLLKTLADSIKLTRPLSDEEIKIVKDLEDQYYDEYYNDKGLYGYQNLSSQGRELMRIWNNKVMPFKKAYKSVSNELDRVTHKFFKSYCNRYGINFCHIAFKFGIISFRGDENPVIEFGRVVQ